MAFLSKAEIIAADDIAYAVVPMPEWGGDVRIKTWSIHECDQAGKLLLTAADPTKMATDMREKIVRLALVDENGNHMFSEKELASLGRKSHTAMNRLFTEVLKHNRLGSIDEGALPNG